MSYVLGAAALSKLVIAHDSSNSDPHTLTSHWEHRSIGEIPLAIRWFYCAGLGLALACMGLYPLPLASNKSCSPTPTHQLITSPQGSSP